MLLVMSVVPFLVYSQGDAFFYESFESRNNAGLNEMNTGMGPAGMSFGNFSTKEFGFNFGGFSDDESGFDFGDFSKDESGFNFGEFDFEDVDAALGNGLFLLSGLAFVRLRFKNKKNK